jgi:hypothetical protein
VSDPPSNQKTANTAVIAIAIMIALVLALVVLTWFCGEMRVRGL